jgi:cytochrome b561
MSAAGASSALPLAPANDAGARGPAYTRTAVALHWIIALLIAGSLSLGLIMVNLHLSPLKTRLFNYHKWIGITVLGLAVIRILWRAGHRPPPEVPMPRWQALAARAAHYLLYALLIVTPVFGWMDSSAMGYPVVYLKLWQLPDLVHKNKELAKVLRQIHSTLGWCVLWLVVLHAGAALKHHFLDRDSTLTRMLAWRRPSAQRP